MQKVSKEYKASMKDSLRERAYIMISFGVVNQEAQAKAKVDSGEFAYFSNPDNLFNEGTDDVVYATLEENFTRVDGSMYFLPRNKPGAMFYNTGLVGKNLVSDGLYEVTINLHAAPTDFRGITINFGENYPTDFDFVTNTGQKVEFRDNDKAVFTTEEVLENVTTLTLVIHKMKNLRSRLRIYSFRFGYGLVYYNDSVMSSSLESSVSFQDITAYTGKEKSFFGAKDANRMNEALNTIMSMVENGTDLYTAFQNYFAEQKTLFEQEADSKATEFDNYTDNLEHEYKVSMAAFESQQQQIYNAWFQAMKDQLSKDAAGNLQNQCTELDERLTLLEQMTMQNDFSAPLATDDEAITLIVDDLDYAILADWKYKEE